MNPIFRHYAENTDGGPLMATMTVVFMATFIYWTWWAYRPAHKEHLEAASRMPLDEEG